MGKNERVWLLLIPIVCWSILAGAAIVGPRFDYNLWDNFEYFTPIVNYAHNLWLKGHVPLWNPYQHLGEPILASGQPGALYLPYTLSVMLVQLLNLDPSRVVLIIVMTHLPIAAIGWFKLFRLLEVRPTLSLFGAISVCFGGFITAITTVWVFMIAVFAWLPWILYGILRHLRSGGWTGIIPVGGGLAATAMVGHPQMFVYQCLATMLFTVGCALFVYKKPLRIVSLAGFFVLSLLVSLPVLLPMSEMLSLSVRTSSFTLDEFLQRGVEPWGLVGWLLPFFKVGNGYLPDRASVTAYQGAWVIPALIAGLMVAVRSARSEENFRQGDQAVRFFVMTCVVTGILGILAMGGHTPLYRLTYGIPVWSSLRWPFKIFLYSQSFLLLSAVFGLELWLRRRSAAWIEGWFQLIFFIAIVGGIVLVRGGDLFAIPESPMDWLSIVGALATLVGLVIFENRRFGKALLLTGGYVTVVSLTAAAHNMPYKIYQERYGTIHAQDLGITTDTRVLPLTAQNGLFPQMQPLALFHSATANNYFSATGTSAGLIPTWFDTSLPVDVFGVPSGQYLGLFLQSNLLKSFNIGYLVVASQDRAMRGFVQKCQGFGLVREDDVSATYKTAAVLPRSYFASHTYPYTLREFREGMLYNKAPVDAAFIDGWQGGEVVAKGIVIASEWGVNRSIIDLNAPEGGFLVLSMSYYPGWSATVDGREVSLKRVNGRLIGLEIPAGARRVIIELQSSGFLIGCLVSLTVVVAVCLVLPLVRRTRMMQKPD